jgi:hypothetical protein
VRLERDQLEQLAAIIAAKLADRISPAPAARETGRMVTPAELAKLLGVDRGWVYEHADKLGVRRLGEGPRARLRFDVEVALAATACPGGRESTALDAPVHAARRRRASSSAGTGVDLLPIRGGSDG